ncbi:hypothetical protein [Azospirillum sp. SYSU D00513]|uniref:hypothetical protein n=1 Tax=Azospirillum sp. SYSU D00513 TaxID=2812561 RepID=UPI001A967A4C|nr:hypothetical protein [Azospirillum sp. SYSU D00513]
MRIATQEMPNRPGYYAVVALAPDGEVIATLAGPFKGDREANKFAKVERERLGKAGASVLKRNKAQA